MGGERGPYISGEGGGPGSIMRPALWAGGDELNSWPLSYWGWCVFAMRLMGRI